MDEKSEREQFLWLLKLGVEQEYNAPNKPEHVENVNKKLLKDKMLGQLKEYCKKNNSSLIETINSFMKPLLEGKDHSPSSEGEINVIIDVLNSIKEDEELQK